MIAHDNDAGVVTNNAGKRYAPQQHDRSQTGTGHDEMEAVARYDAAVHAVESHQAALATFQAEAQQLNIRMMAAVAKAADEIKQVQAARLVAQASGTKRAFAHQESEWTPTSQEGNIPPIAVPRSGAQNTLLPMSSKTTLRPPSSDHPRKELAKTSPVIVNDSPRQAVAASSAATPIVTATTAETNLNKSTRSKPPTTQQLYEGKQRLTTPLTFQEMELVAKQQGFILPDKCLRAIRPHERQILNAYRRGALILRTPPQFVNETLPQMARVALLRYHVTQLQTTLVAKVPPPSQVTWLIGQRSIFKHLYVANEGDEGQQRIDALQDIVVRARLNIKTRELFFTFPSKAAAQPWIDRQLLFLESTITLTDPAAVANAAPSGAISMATRALLYTVTVFGWEGDDPMLIHIFFTRLLGPGLIVHEAVHDNPAGVERDEQYWHVTFTGKACPTRLVDVRKIVTASHGTLYLHHRQTETRPPCMKCLSSRHTTAKCKGEHAEQLRARYERTVAGYVPAFQGIQLRQGVKGSLNSFLASINHEGEQGKLISEDETNSLWYEGEDQTTPRPCADGESIPELQSSARTKTSVFSAKDSKPSKEVQNASPATVAKPTFKADNGNGFIMHENKRSRRGRKQKQGQQQCGQEQNGPAGGPAVSSTTPAQPSARQQKRAASKLAAERRMREREFITRQQRSTAAAPAANSSSTSEPSIRQASDAKGEQTATSSSEPRETVVSGAQLGMNADNNYDNALTGEDFSQDQDTVNPGHLCEGGDSESAMADEEMKENDTEGSASEQPPMNGSPTRSKRQMSVETPHTPRPQTRMRLNLINDTAPSNKISGELKQETSSSSSVQVEIASHRRGKQTSLHQYLYPASPATPPGALYECDEDTTSWADATFLQLPVLMDTVPGVKTTNTLEYWMALLGGASVEVPANGQCGYVAWYAATVQYKTSPIQLNADMIQEANDIKQGAIDILLAGLHGDTLLNAFDLEVEYARLFPLSPIPGKWAAVQQIYNFYEQERSRSVTEHVASEMWVGSLVLKAMAQFRREPLYVIDVFGDGTTGIQRYLYETKYLPDCGTTSPASLEFEVGYSQLIQADKAVEIFQAYLRRNSLPLVLVLNHQKAHFGALYYGQRYQEWMDQEPTSMRQRLWATHREIRDTEYDCGSVDMQAMGREASQVAQTIAEELVSENAAFHTAECMSFDEGGNASRDTLPPRGYSPPAPGHWQLYQTILDSDREQQPIHKRYRKRLEGENHAAFMMWKCHAKRQFDLPQDMQSGDSIDVLGQLTNHNTAALSHLVRGVPHPELLLAHFTAQQIQQWGALEVFKRQKAVIQATQIGNGPADLKAFCASWLEECGDGSQSTHRAAAAKVEYWEAMSTGHPEWIQNMSRSKSITLRQWRILHLLPIGIRRWSFTKVAASSDGPTVSWFTDNADVQAACVKAAAHGNWIGLLLLDEIVPEPTPSPCSVELADRK